jgi:hypothetical protein
MVSVLLVKLMGRRQMLNQLKNRVSNTVDRIMAYGFRAYKFALQPGYLAAKSIASRRAKKFLAEGGKIEEDKALISPNIIGMIVGFGATAIGTTFALLSLVTSMPVLGPVLLAVGGTLLTGSLMGASDGVSQAVGEKPFFFKEENTGFRSFFGKSVKNDFALVSVYSDTKASPAGQKNTLSNNSSPRPN